MGYTDYTTPTEAVNQWVEAIAPMYFDFDTSQLHRTGVFGYINEVMATANMDTYHGVAVARREFYPTTANYTKSLFKMAALQQIDYPMAHAATASCTLLLREDELLKYGVLEDGTSSVYKIVIDNDMIMMADDIPFMLDYPVKILFKKTPVISKGANDTIGEYNNQAGVVHVAGNKIYYTIGYDITYDNSLNTQTEKYLRHRTLSYAGQNLLLIQLGIRQCTRTISEQTINKSPSISVITLDFPYDGDLCNFEVFYTPNGTTDMIQLKKLPLNANPINDNFCMYSLTSDNNIRIHFPENNYFTPKFNSKIILHIYTTLGESGNFRLFNGELLCSPSSETYAYNKSLTIQGQIRGASEGGYDMPTFEDFRQKIVRAYATNEVKCTEQDLQMYFDEQMATQNNKILFFKRRDDVFERLYGAFMLLKDMDGNLIPTNSLVADLRIDEDFTDEEKKAYAYGTGTLPTTLIIKPGSIWRYSVPHHAYYDGDGYHVERAYVTELITSKNYLEIAGKTNNEGLPLQYRFEDGTVRELSCNKEDANYAGNYIGERVYAVSQQTRLSLGYDITDSTEEMLYANPFLISISRARNSIAYYINSFDTTAYLNMVDVNDSSYIQFINTAFLVQRNAMLGENFYKLTIKLQPTIEDENLRQTLVITREELEQIEATAKKNGTENEYVNDDFPLEIRADYEGVVVGYKWMSSTKYYCTCQETTGIEHHGELCPSCHTYVTAHTHNAIYQVVRYTPDPSYNINYDDITRYGYQEGLDDTDEFGNFLAYIRVSPAVSCENVNGENIYDSSAWYNAIYHPGDRFGQYDILATRKCKDLLVLRVIGEIEGVYNKYIPFFIEDYNEESDLYTLSAYLSTDDEISDDGKLTITGGFYHDTNVESSTPYSEPLTINPYNCRISVSSYLRYDDVNGNSLNNYEYLKRHVFTNVYSNMDTIGIDFLKKFDFVRSTLISHDALGTPNDPHRITIKEIPLVRASWIKKSTNFTQLLNYLNSNYNFIENTYDLLENNYTIDMKFYNTYGKSRFYEIGIGDPNVATDNQLMTLDDVNISIKFGVRISSISDSTMFKERFVKYIREYVENLNEISRDGDSINLMDMVTDINNNFDEIERLEFYGIDDLDASRAQIIRSWSSEEIMQLGYKEYIPEFINVYLKYNLSTDTYEPDIEITELP